MSRRRASGLVVSISIACVLATLSSPVAGGVAKVAPEGARAVAVAPTERGYVAVWHELARGHFFRAFDATGAPLGDATPYAAPSSATFQTMVPTGDEDWLVAAHSFNSPAIWTVRLSGDGSTVAGPTVISDSSGFFVISLEVDLATDGVTALATWSEDVIAGDVVYAQALDPDGVPSAPRSTLMAVPLQISAPFGVRPVASPGGYYTVWTELGQAVRARESKRDGRPLGSLEEIARVPVSDAIPLRIGAHETVAYFAGRYPRPGEILVARRTRRGAYADPVALFGPDRVAAALDGAATDGRRIAVLFTEAGAGGLLGQRFAEFDEDLEPIGDVRDPSAETGVAGLHGLAWDPHRERWLVLGSDGPDGRGTYVVNLEPAAP